MGRDPDLTCQDEDCGCNLREGRIQEITAKFITRFTADGVVEDQMDEAILEFCADSPETMPPWLTDVTANELLAFVGHILAINERDGGDESADDEEGDETEQHAHCEDCEDEDDEENEKRCPRCGCDPDCDCECHSDCLCDCHGELDDGEDDSGDEEDDDGDEDGDEQDEV